MQALLVEADVFFPEICKKGNLNIKLILIFICIHVGAQSDMTRVCVLMYVKVGGGGGERW